MGLVAQLERIRLQWETQEDRRREWFWPVALAWRIPWTEVPGVLQPMGVKESHRLNNSFS